VEEAEEVVVEAAAEAAAVVVEVWKLKNLKEKQKNTEDTREKHVEIEESKQLTDCVKRASYIIRPEGWTIPEDKKPIIIDMSAPGKLLLISDLEGCNPHSAAKAPQSQVLCGEEFFTAVREFLSRNPENKVAFLGDYFDQGPLVVDSVNRIIALQEAFSDRVTILMGNRDLNKLRFIYELNADPQVSGALKWSAWTEFYAALIPPSLPLTLKDRVKLILNKSMGALNPMPQLDVALSEDEACYLLVKAFSKPVADTLPNAAASEASLQANGPKYEQFCANVKKLFTVGKIVSYDADYKTLLSHAGGAEPFLLHDPSYYEDIRAALSPIKAYYDKIETVRLKLQNEPATKVKSFIESTYNAPLSAIPSMFDAHPGSEPPFEHFLLQGLGLKPNPAKHFNSFVQSCDVQGCKGPYHTDMPMDPALDYARFLQALEESGVKFIAHGHVPHCVPVPLIYKRQESNIIFLANDTSNGYRPADIASVDQFPLSYISKDEKVGVFSLPGSTERTYDAGSMFKSMIGEWTLDNVPTFMTDALGPRVQYAEGKALTFPARAETKTPGIFKPATMAGGNRKRKTIRRQRKLKGGKSRKGRK
jgi:hypothetical protein